MFAPIYPVTVTLNTIEHGDPLIRVVNVWPGEGWSSPTLNDEQATTLLTKGEVEIAFKEVAKEIAFGKQPKQQPMSLKSFPPDPCPQEYLSGRQVWKGADGSTWRYSTNQKKWIKTGGA